MGKQVEGGELEEKRQGSCSALKEVTDVLNTKSALPSLGFTRARTNTHTHTLGLIPPRFTTGADASQ